MSSVSRWRDSGHLEKAVQTAGGPEAFGAAVAGMLDDAQGWRLADLRKRRGMTQEQVVTRNHGKYLGPALGRQRD